MTFADPVFLIVLAVVLPAALWASGRVRRRHAATLAVFGDPALLGRSSPLHDPARARRRLALRLSAVSLGLLALARPQWGDEPSALPRTGRDVLVLLDLSRSMNVADGGGATRLSVAKRLITSVTSASPGDRLGLVVFGAGAFLQLPLTQDHAAFQAFLDAASSDDLGDPATNIAGALRTALTVFQHEGEPGPRVVLLVSDGESSGGDAAPGEISGAADELRKAGTPIFALGVGTLAGGRIPADSTEAPEPWHRDYIGRVVVSRLEESNLRLAAQRSGGAYARWDTPTELRALTTRLTNLDTRTLASTTATQRVDRFQWPLALAVLAMLAELVLSGRRTAVPAMLLVATIASCRATGWQERRGEQLYTQGKYAEAYRAFQDVSASGASAAASYNAGNALYRMRRYEDAIKQFRDIPDASGDLRLRSRFNLGNAYVRASEEQEGADQRESLRRAVAAYEEVLQSTPNDSTAKWNLELAVRRLGDEGDGGGSPGRGNRADYGRGNMDDPDYEGNEQAAVGAMAGGGYGSAEGESAEELNEAQARQLLEAVQREQLRSHEGRRTQRASAGQNDW